MHTKERVWDIAVLLTFGELPFSPPSIEYTPAFVTVVFRSFILPLYRGAYKIRRRLSENGEGQAFAFFFRIPYH
jgi:hypothetical protein